MFLLIQTQTEGGHSRITTEVVRRKFETEFQLRTFLAEAGSIKEGLQRLRGCRTQNQTGVRINEPY